MRLCHRTPLGDRRAGIQRARERTRVSPGPAGERKLVVMDTYSQNVLGKAVQRCRATALFGLSVWLGSALSLSPSLAGQEPPVKPDPATAPTVKEATPEVPVKTLAGDAAQPDATTILKRAEAACRALTSIRYSVRTERPGATGAQRNLIDGTVLVRGWKGEHPERFRYEMRVYPKIDAPKDIILGYDGEVYYAIDPQAKTVTAGPTPDGFGSLGLHWKRFGVDEFVRPRPFEDEIIARQAEYRGVLMLGDEECESVFVRYASAEQEAVWYFSKKDFLPRRVDRKLRSRDGATLDHQWVITNLKLDAHAGDEAFKLKVPEGFTRRDIPPR